MELETAASDRHPPLELVETNVNAGVEQGLERGLKPARLDHLPKVLELDAGVVQESPIGAVMIGVHASLGQPEARRAVGEPMLAHRLRLLGIDRATQKRAQAHGQPAEQLGLAEETPSLRSPVLGRSAQPALDQLKLKAAASQTPRSHVDSLDAECEG